jgi:hypothetical protein
LTTLVSDARRQAEALASAAGMRLGGIVTLSDQTGDFGGMIGIPSANAPPYFKVGDFDDLRAHVSPAPRRPCVMAVQFRLLP